MMTPKIDPYFVIFFERPHLKNKLLHIFSFELAVLSLHFYQSMVSCIQTFSFMIIIIDAVTAFVKTSFL